MAIKGMDFEINGVKYNAAEDAEGEHYILGGEPLRPPNAVTVQGENSQKFQMRPDTLLWTLTDWSGGEGQRKFNAQLPNRHLTLDAVSVFERPGTLRPGPYVEDTQDTTGSADLAVELRLVVANGILYGFGKVADSVYVWDSGNNKWGAASTLTGPAAGMSAVCSDGTYVFTVEGGVGDVWRFPAGSTTGTALVTTGIDSNSHVIVEQGNNVYVFGSTSANIYEIAKTISAASAIDSFSVRSSTAGMVSLDGKVYAMASTGTVTEIREITPSSAAGTGFGRQFAKLPGFSATDIWAHGGQLFLVGSFSDTSEAVVLYVGTDGTYGTLGHVRYGDVVSTAFGSRRSAGGNVRMLDHFFVTKQRNASDTKASLWQIDAVSGGITNLAYATDTSAAAGTPRSVVCFEDDIFMATSPTAFRVLRAKGGTFSKASSVTSPWHDFDLADEKVLAGLTLSVEALPADWDVVVAYAVDGSTSYTTAITYSTTGGKGTTVQISTDSSTKLFRTLSIKITMTYTGSGVPTTAPVVLGVDARAMVNKPQRLWKIMVDLSDGHSQANSKPGSYKLAKIKIAVATGGAIDFKNGYEDRDTNKYEQVDVVVDSYVIVVTKPGEGYAALTLKEVF